MAFDVKAFALAAGTLWGVTVLVLGLSATAGWGVALVDLLASIYVGYEASLLGSAVGLAYGFVDGQPAFKYTVDERSLRLQLLAAT